MGIIVGRHRVKIAMGEVVNEPFRNGRAPTTLPVYATSSDSGSSDQSPYFRSLISDFSRCDIGAASLFDWDYGSDPACAVIVADLKQARNPWKPPPRSKRSALTPDLRLPR